MLLLMLTALVREVLARTVRAFTAPLPPHRPVTVLEAARATALTAAAGTVDEVDADTRTLSGMVLPFGEVGHTSIGPVVVASDARISWPEDLGRIKLVDTHAKPPRSIGYATAARQTDTGWRATFHVGDTDLGSSALLEASENLRDGFSVELYDLEFNARGHLSAGSVSAVSFEVTPAFPSARHDGMAAANTPESETTRMLTDEERARLDELLAKDRTDEENAELRQLMSKAVGEDPPAEDPPAEDPPADAQAQLAAGHTARRPATVPGSVPSSQRQSHRRPTELRELYAATARVLSGQSRPELEAALSDVTSTANIWVAPDEYAGQLWSGLEYRRRYVQNSTPGPLNSYKGSGWRWVVKPAVGDYAGDKAAVPSNQPTTEDSSWVAARLAGAHDLDRKFFDFGDTEFIEAYYAAMREDYAVKSDTKALAFQLASAVALVGAESSLFRAAAVAAQAVEDNTLGQSVDYFYINSADKLSLLDLTESDIPAYLEVFGVTPDKFESAPGVAPGTVVAGTKLATKFRELTETPIRVEAINVANGGIDGGVFGYYATEETFAGGIVSKTFV